MKDITYLMVALILTNIFVIAVNLWFGIGKRREHGRCKDCKHCKPLPKDAEEALALIYGGDGKSHCTACRGEDYDLGTYDTRWISVVSHNGFCDEWEQR